MAGCQKRQVSVTLATLTKKTHTNAHTHREKEINYEHKTTKNERKDSEITQYETTQYDCDAGVSTISGKPTDRLIRCQMSVVVSVNNETRKQQTYLSVISLLIIPESLLKMSTIENHMMCLSCAQKTTDSAERNQTEI